MSLGSDWLESPSKGVMHLYVLLVCVLWGSESHFVPRKGVTVTPEKNLTALCDEIQRDLTDDKKIYKGSFNRPQNTSEELCCAEFTELFTSTLKNLTDHNKANRHINNVYQNMKELPEICPKLKPTGSSKGSAIEQSDFSMFKEALESVITSIEGWKSCEKIQGSPRDSVLSQG